MSFEGTAPFRPARFLRRPNLQTLAGKLLRPEANVAMEPLRVELPDGDFLDLVLSPRCKTSGDPLVLVLHGLEGSTDRRYMRLAFRALLGRGLAPAGMNFRGCSGEPNRLPRAYHSGDTADLRFVLEYLTRAFPGRPLGLAGFSLGGNVTLRLLAESTGIVRRVCAAAVVSVPFDLAACAATLEGRGFAAVYRSYFLRSLKEKVRVKRRLLEPVADVGAALEARTLRAFDDAITAPLHGFADASDYYRQCSSAASLSAIATPVLIIHARDDPFLPAAAIPVRAARDNQAVHLLLTEHGGHLGFITGKLGDHRSWAEETLAGFLAAKLHAACGLDSAEPTR